MLTVYNTESLLANKQYLIETFSMEFHPVNPWILYDVVEIENGVRVNKLEYTPIQNDQKLYTFEYRDFKEYFILRDSRAWHITDESLIVTYIIFKFPSQ